MLPAVLRADQPRQHPDHRQDDHEQEGDQLVKVGRGLRLVEQEAAGPVADKLDLADRMAREGLAGLGDLEDGFEDDLVAAGEAAVLEGIEVTLGRARAGAPASALFGH